MAPSVHVLAAVVERGMPLAPALFSCIAPTQTVLPALPFLMISLPAVPLAGENTNFEVPVPPSSVSLPAPPISVSFPPPPIKRSSPTPPSKLSSPSPPSRVSLPLPPFKTSLPLLPVNTLLTSLPTIVSLPSPPLAFSIVAPSAMPIFLVPPIELRVPGNNDMERLLLAV